MNNVKKKILILVLVATIMPPSLCNDHGNSWNPFYIFNYYFGTIPSVVTYPFKKGAAFVGAFWLFLSNGLVEKHDLDDIKEQLKRGIDKDTAKKLETIHKMEEGLEAQEEYTKALTHNIKKVQESNTETTAFLVAHSKSQEEKNSEIESKRILLSQTAEELTDSINKKFKKVRSSLQEKNRQQQSVAKGKLRQTFRELKTHEQYCKKEITNQNGQLAQISGLLSQNQKQNESISHDIKDLTKTAEKDIKRIGIIHSKVSTLEEDHEKEDELQNTIFLFQKQYQETQLQTEQLASEFELLTQKNRFMEQELKMRRMATQSPVVAGLLANLISIGVVTNSATEAPKQLCIMNK